MRFLDNVPVHFLYISFSHEPDLSLWAYGTAGTAQRVPSRSTLTTLAANRSRQPTFSQAAVLTHPRLQLNLHTAGHHRAGSNYHVSNRCIRQHVPLINAVEAGGPLSKFGPRAARNQRYHQGKPASTSGNNQESELASHR